MRKVVNMKRKKNDPQAIGPLVSLCPSVGKLQEVKYTTSVSRCFCQVQNTVFLQADLFSYRCLEFDLFGLHTAGEWYD